ncbi:hypothetical protein DFQ27_008612 [Actinomortierella ambigua]|uniref:Crinkler effector protein N-terminal domain-containing protein n=1 Tax=Actinomortierella ambigua TaxID=1343610 RepID=A0A9P6QKE9_9FUNG|nr:hypothetical protein DFQ27_008612 [Actinomortierella ambigua]
MNTSSLTVFCVIDGESTFNAFSVEVDPTKTVEHLKDLIKAKLSPEFDDIVAKSLTLWRVSIADGDDDDEQPIVLDSILEKKKLEATRELSEVFETSLHKNTDTIHIIVQRPPLQGNAHAFCDLHTDIKRITDKFFAPGSDVATFLDRFVRGLENLPLTTGSVSGLPRVWLRNKDPRTDTRPSLLFLDLPHPSPSNIRSKYPTSDAILQLIERCPTPGSNVAIFGVSGCGKTRGMIELLSRRWGFYFNAAPNDLGSGDITTLVDHIKPHLQQDRESNNRQARTITYLLLLSRLKILQHCLTISESHQTFTSARWTILQTCPHVLNNDVFNQLFQEFLPALSRHQTPPKEVELMEAVQKELQATKDLLVEHGRLGGLPSFKDRDKLLVVHDEAQILGDSENGRFESMSSDKLSESLLSPILWGFRMISTINLTLLTCGTGLSIFTLDCARSCTPFIKSTKALTDKSKFEYIEFPGWTGRESIEAYVAGLQRLRPTKGARQALDRLLPAEAIQAITERLVGRLRPTVSCVEKTIARGEPGGWKDALDDTETRLVSYDHCREQGNLCNETVRLENKYRENLSIFNELRTVQEVLGLFIFQRYMFGADKLVLQEVVPELVECAFGRIMIVDGVARTILDEPFVLKAAENYFKMRDAGFMKTLDYWVQQSDKAQARGYAWELMMMNVLTETFKIRTLSDWPHEPSIPSQCAMLDGNAVIVGLDEQAFQHGISHEHISMRGFMDAHVNNGSSRRSGAVPPFFFPKANPSGPDIVFCIRVQDRLFPVFVQLKLRQTMATKDVHAAVKTVSASMIEDYVQDLSGLCPNNVFISMVIVYPAEVVAKLRPRPDIQYNLRPRHDSKPTRLTQVQVVIDESNISKIFPKSHVDFLDEIKDPMKRQAEDTL